MRTALAVTACLAAALVGFGCSSSQTTSSADSGNGPVHVKGQHATTDAALSTPPPAISTPVPIIKAHVVSAAGRGDPFVVLFGPPQTSTSTAAKPVVSAFPKIPTLPGFEGPPTAGSRPPSIWDGVRVTGILQSGGYTAIIEANGKAYVAHAGDFIGDKYRVLAIGPRSVTLVADHQQRAFALGG